jgi:outer membrane protein assembly factor BamB
MVSSPPSNAPTLRRWTLCAIGVAFSLGVASPLAAQVPGPSRVDWWIAPTAEAEDTSWTADTPVAGQIVASVPGAIVLLATNEQGRITRRHNLASDPAAPFGFATANGALAVFDRQRGLRLWNLLPNGSLALRWRRLLDERATSLGWDGGERVFVATWNQRIHAFSAADGQALWATTIDGKADAPPRIVGSTLLVATKSQSLQAFDALTGRLRWAASLPGPVLHPLAVHQIGTRSVVLCAPWSGYLVAIEGQTGKPLWEAELPARVAGAPLLVGKTVAVATADGAVQSFALDGTPRWKTEGVAGEQTSLLLDRTATPPRVIAVSTRVTALVAETGEKVREYPEDATQDLRQRFANAMIEGERTYSETEKRALLAQGAFDLNGPLAGAASAPESLLVFGTEEGWAYLFDRRLLRPLWRLHQGAPPTGPATTRDQRVFLSAGEEVIAVDRGSGQRFWRRNVGAQVVHLEAGPSLGVLTRDRASLLALDSGAVEHSWRGSFVMIEHGPNGWLLAQDSGRMLTLADSGEPSGTETTLAGALTEMIPAADGAWVAARRDGTVSGLVRGPGGAVIVDWEHAFDAPPRQLRTAERKTLVQLESRLVCLDGAAPIPLWETESDPNQELIISPDTKWLVQLGRHGLVARDLATGAVGGSWPIDAPVVGAIIDTGHLVWWDRLGRCQQLDLGSGSVVPLADLGRSLESATPREAGWIVTSSGGEVAWVEMAPLPPAGLMEGEPQ